MRSRNLKPGFFQNEQLAELPVEARLLFLGLTLIADREGRLEDRPKRIKMLVFPADLIDVEPLLTGLAEQELIVRYQAEGNAYIWIPTFTKHQKPHPREAESSIPPYSGDTQATPGYDPGNTKELSSPAESLNPESLNGDKKDTSRRNGARVPSRHIDLIFTHWQREHEHAGAKCSEKRRRLIAQRLKDYSVEQLRECISGYKLSPFHRGENERSQRYDSIELMLRDSEHVERGIQFFHDPPRKANGTSGQARKPSAVERAQRATGGGF